MRADNISRKNFNISYSYSTEWRLKKWCCAFWKYLQWIDLNFKQSWILLFASYLCLCFDHWLKHCAILLVVTAKDNCIKLRWTLMEVIICNYLFESKWYPTISAKRSGCLEVLKNVLGKKYSDKCLRNIVGYLAISAWHTCRKWVSGEPCLKGGVL